MREDTDFQSTLLREERPTMMDAAKCETIFSIHAPTRGATYIIGTYRAKEAFFQSTLLREERPARPGGN